MKNERLLSRQSALKEAIAGRRADGLIVSNIKNIRYISGFSGSFAMLVVTQKKSIFLTDFRYVEQAEKETKGFDEIVLMKKDAFLSLSEAVKKLKIRKVGFESKSVFYEDYKEISKKLPGVAMIPTRDAVENLRKIKDEDEIKLMAESARVADSAFPLVLKKIKPGMTELDLSAELEYRMKKAGSEKNGFEIIVASGKRSSLPHGVASKKKIERGDVITFDFGAVHEGYCSDTTRTVFLGEPSGFCRKIYSIVKTSQESALSKVREGIRWEEVDRGARSIIERKGYGKDFGHGIGHSVGLEVHDPKIDKKDVLKKNMVVTIEPGIYLKDKFGVRIEDMVVVEKDECRILTGITKDIVVV